MVQAAYNWPYRVDRTTRPATPGERPHGVNNDVVVSFGTPHSGWRFERERGDYTIMLSRAIGTIGLDLMPRDYSFLKEWDEPDPEA